VLLPSTHTLTHPIFAAKAPACNSAHK
jgi:hypothetical protein